VAFKFSDGDRWGDLRRALWHQLLGGARHWHNRIFTRGQTIDRDEGGWLIRWQGRGGFRARPLADLPCHGRRGVILASGPSVRQLRRPERLFTLPVACVNGSVVLARDLGCRVAAYFVSDHRFVLDCPAMFRAGVALADAVVLGTSAAFAALLATPDVLRRAELAGTPIYLRENLRRPFKRPRPSTAELIRDPALLTSPDGGIVFSLDPARGTCPAGTVVYDVLQVLYGVGYRELFMFGVDLSAGPRFYREHAPAANGLADSYERSIEPAFRLVARYLDRSGRTLVNGSAGSRLPAGVVPRVDGNELLDAIAGRRATVRPWQLARAA